MDDVALTKYQRRRQVVKIVRNLPGVVPLPAFVLGFTSELLFVHFLDEFHLNGYCIVRRRDITKIRCGKDERFHQRMLKAEGIVDRVGFEATIDLGSWRLAFASLKRLQKHVSVSGEDSEDPVTEGGDMFFIGRIVRINQKSVTLRHFDSEGWWEKRTRTVCYDDITMVDFDDEYITTYSKYLRKAK